MLRGIRSRGHTGALALDRYHEGDVGADWQAAQGKRARRLDERGAVG